jgi:hypothetical protein
MSHGVTRLRESPEKEAARKEKEKAQIVEYRALVQDVLTHVPPSQTVHTCPQNVCHEFAKLLGHQFRISNQGPVSSFLGINIDRNHETVFLNQIGYIDKMANRFQLQVSNPIHTPLDHSSPLVNGNQDDARADATAYKELIGSFNHLAIYTRPCLPCRFQACAIQSRSGDSPSHCCSTSPQVCRLKQALHHQV